jgi:DNA-directed RNA polymerase specialized sigma24 family protein
MSKYFTSDAGVAAVGALQQTFLKLLPTIESVARLRCRRVSCANRREDCIGEIVAVAWKWHVRLAERGRDCSQFVVTFAHLAVRAVMSGRRLCGQERVHDVMSPSCRRRHGFGVARFDGSIWSDVFADALADNTHSPVPVQVQFRGNFAAWVSRMPARQQQVLTALAVGERTQDVARATGVSAAQISQMRGELRRSYLQFLTDS